MGTNTEPEPDKESLGVGLCVAEAIGEAIANHELVGHGQLLGFDVGELYRGVQALTLHMHAAADALDTVLAELAKLTPPG